MPPPLSDRRRKAIAALTQKKYRERAGQLLVEGWRSVASALAAEATITEVVVTEAVYADAKVQATLAQAGVAIYLATERVLAQLSDVRTSPGIAAVAALPDAALDALSTAQRVLALDGVQDPGNVGTLLRTAAWYGLDGVIAGPGTADLFSPKVVRAAMGGLWDLTLVRTTDLGGALAFRGAFTFTRYGADLAGTPASEWTPSPPAVLVLGSEAHGLSPAVHPHLDARVALPGNKARRGVESLNVAVAGGILMDRWLLAVGR